MINVKNDSVQRTVPTAAPERCEPSAEPSKVPVPVVDVAAPVVSQVNPEVQRSARLAASSVDEAMRARLLRDFPKVPNASANAASPNAAAPNAAAPNAAAPNAAAPNAAAPNAAAPNAAAPNAAAPNAAAPNAAAPNAAAPNAAAPVAPAAPSDPGNSPTFEQAASGDYLRQGQHGASVVELKNLMRAQGIQVDAGDRFTPETKAAVREFQRTHGCKVDGLVGPETLGALGIRFPSGGASGPGGAPSLPGSAANGAALPAPPGSSSSSGDVVQRLNPAGNPKYLPHDGNTYCNVFTQDVVRARGITDFPQANANNTHQWLGQQGASHGWRQVSGEEAQAAVNAGAVGVVTHENPSGHGHIAPIIEGQTVSGAPMIANAGSNNFNSGPATRSLAFTNPSTTHYWVHDAPAGAAPPAVPNGSAVAANGTAPTAAPGATAPVNSPPQGQNVPGPAGFRPASRPSPQAVAKANEILRSSNPIGSHVPVTLDGKEYVFAVEWHKHAATDNVSDRLKQWHRGVTVYEK